MNIFKPLPAEGSNGAYSISLVCYFLTCVLAYVTFVTSLTNVSIYIQIYIDIYVPVILIGHNLDIFKLES